MDYFNGLKILKLEEAPFFGRVRYLEKLDSTVIPSILRGILFLIAFWSGPARQSFARLKETLERHDPDGVLEVVIVDVDGCGEYQAVPELSEFASGKGEAAWIVQGKILVTAAYDSPPDTFEKYTQFLLVEGLAETIFGKF